MAETLFTTSKGFAIEDEATGNNIFENFSVAGVPSSAGLTADELALSDNAPIGSKATDSVSGFEYRKKTAGAGESTWTRIATVDDIALVTSSDSWRDPAQLKDDTAYAALASAETAVNTGTIDGVAVAEGDRILFTNITSEGKNIFIVTGTVGAGATLVEDANAETHNDVLLIDDGTAAGKEFHYNDVSLTWVESGQNGTNEDGFQNAYMGKPATGTQVTAYTSQTLITNGDSLTIAIGKLDAGVDANSTAIGSQATSINNLQTEVNQIELALGASIDVNGNYVTNSGTNYIDSNNDLSEDLIDLDAQIKVNEDAIAALGGNATASGVTAATVIDSVLVDTVKLVRWLVHVQQGTKVTTYEVDATHDGTVGGDASAVDFTKYARLKLNGNIAGLIITATLNGVGAAQTMNIVVEASAGVDVNTTRHQVI